MLEWNEYVDLLKPAAQLLDQTTAPVDEQLRAEMCRQFAMAMSQSYFLIFMADAEFPEFMPFENSVFMCQPNPDGVYYVARIDGAGTYKVVGERGNAVVAGFATGNKMFGLADEWGKGFHNYDVDNLDINPDGTFEVIFSQEKPKSWDGNWLYLHPQADFILLRQFNYHWGREVDMRIAIERLDQRSLTRPRMSADTTDKLLQQFMKYARRLTHTAVAQVKRPHDQGWINKCHLNHFEDMGNGKDWPQSYYEAVFEIGLDEALVLETDVPDECLYWNTQVIDGLWNQVDIPYRQSSLNGGTAKLSDDGKYRAVLSAKDPGYHNWLDTGDHTYGMIIGRWYRASSAPVPALTRMKLSQVEGYLGDKTPRITPKERKAQMRERLIGSQLRRKW